MVHFADLPEAQALAKEKLKCQSPLDWISSNGMSFALITPTLMAILLYGDSHEYSLDAQPL